VGKGSQSSETTVKQELSPEQRKIMQSTMNQYMPSGQFSDKPTFNPSQTQAGENRIAAFTPDQLKAFDLARTTALDHVPNMNWATQTAKNSAAPTGQKIALGQGWTTNADGSAKFNDWNTSTISQYMNPYQQNVIDAGIGEMNTQYDKMQLANNNAAAEAGAFGGSRHGVLGSGTADAYQKNLNSFLANTLNQGYTQARSDYDSDRSYGQEAIGWNKKVEDDNMARMTSAADQVAKLAAANQDLTGKGINQIGAVGDAIQGRKQSVLDTSYEDMMNDYLWSAQPGQMLSGFTPAATTTQTQKTGGAGSIWGSVGSAALGSIAQALPMMLSDEDTKEKIEEADPEKALASIRKLAGRGLYTYEYKKDAQENMGAPCGPRTGFMAQDYAKATGKPNPKIGGHEHVDSMELLGRLVQSVAALDKKVSGKRAA